MKRPLYSGQDKLFLLNECFIWFLGLSTDSVIDQHLAKLQFLWTVWKMY